jgi:transcription factor C subunit 3
MTNTNLLDVVQELMKRTVPLIYWVGYASLSLVSALFVKSWSIKISESPVVRIFPRRWLDTQGRQVVEYWQAALKAVLGLIIFRPGISEVGRRGKILQESNCLMQTEITWRLKSTYDKQEVHDITRHLIKQGFLRIQICAEDGGFQDTARSFDRNEGRHVFYFIGDRRWYQA